MLSTDRDAPRNHQITIGIDHPHERFKAYVSALTRLRWFLLITTGLSCSLLLHMYLEQFSYQEAQLIGYMSKREQRIEELRALRDAAIKNAPPGKNPDFGQWASLAYETRRSNNTIHSVSMNDANRSLPWLGFAIPANDYLPFGFLILTVFVAGSFLCFCSVAVVVREIEQEGELAAVSDLLRLHFTFTGFLKGEPSAKLGEWLEVCALWLPAASMALAGGTDLESVWKPHGYIGSPRALLVRFAFLGVLFAITFFLTKVSSWEAKRLDKMIRAASKRDPRSDKLSRTGVLEVLLVRSRRWTQD